MSRMEHRGRCRLLVPWAAARQDKLPLNAAVVMGLEQDRLWEWLETDKCVEPRSVGWVLQLFS